jgi:glycerophosphoryl diester phosphodiesterase
MAHSFFDVENPVVIGHRGAAGERPENTLVSFETALAQGAQILESDIHVSRDGVPILLHDPELDRTTDGAGLASASTWSELERLDAGCRFEGAESGESYAGRGIGIPSLEQAFERFPDARFNLEIKCHDQAGIRATLDLIDRFDRADRTLLAAGDDAIMSDLRRHVAAHRVAPAMGASLGEIVAATRSAVEGTPMPVDVMALQIPASFGGQPLVTDPFVKHAHAHGVEIHVWTINALSEIESLLKLGVDGIVTDFPGQMSEWLGRAGSR